MTFRICAIGCGGMSTSVHGPSFARYAAEHADTELTACCDLNAAKAEAYRARFGFLRSHTDVGRMLEAERPDAVCVIVPESLACEVACSVLAHGVPMMTEKPPGETTAQLERMIATARDTPTAVAFNRRFTPLLRRLRALLDQRFEPPAIQHVRLNFLRIGRKDRDFSATAIHGIDSARFVAGSDYESLRFRYRHFHEHGPTVANIHVDGVFASGATVQMNFCPVTGVLAERLEVYCEDEAFFLEMPLNTDGFDYPGRLRHIRRGQALLDVTAGDEGPGVEFYLANGFYGENEAFFNAVRKGLRPAWNLESARQAVRIAEAVRDREAALEFSQARADIREEVQP